MRVHFERTGGFAGLRLGATIDGKNLPPEELRELEEEVRAARFFDLPAQMQGAGGEVDRFQYTITVEHEGKRHTVAVSESAVTDALRSLVEHLSRLARARP